MKNKLVEQGKDYLEHYGVKGMRWGVRKDRKSRSRSAESSEVQRLRGRKAFELSDDDLRKVSSRIELEKRYTSSVTPTSKKIVNEAVKNSGTKLLAAGLTWAGTKAAKAIVGLAVTAYKAKKGGG